MKKTLPILLLIFVSCGPVGGPVNFKPNLDLSYDPLSEYHQRPLDVTQTENVSLIRKKQIIVRHDCNGHVTSNKLETILSPSKKLTSNYENRKTSWSFEVYNRTTRSGNKGFFVDTGEFVIDYAPTLFNMYVKDGINDIEYVFKKCTKISVDANREKICIGEILTEKEGIIRVDVTYVVEIVPGEQYIYPSAEKCKSNPSENVRL